MILFVKPDYFSNLYNDFAYFGEGNIAILIRKNISEKYGREFARYFEESLLFYFINYGVNISTTLNNVCFYKLLFLAKYARDVKILRAIYNKKWSETLQVALRNNPSFNYKDMI